jgi:enoyl-CoA hydratase/carnithine racemase
VTTVLDVAVTDRAVYARVNRPEVRNAWDRVAGDALDAVLDLAAGHPVPLVLGSTTPGMFVSGADLAEIAARRRGDGLARRNSSLFQRLEDHPYPTVAVVDGPALGGGCELALACDFRVATPRSLWGLPEVTLGLLPGAGGMWRLPRAVGWSRAVDLVMTGRRIDGAEAHRIGLVQRLAPVEELDAAVDTLLAELARTSVRAVSMAKELMRVAGDHRRVGDAIAMGLQYEDADTAERIQAFLDGRRG